MEDEQHGLPLGGSFCIVSRIQMSSSASASPHQNSIRNPLYNFFFSKPFLRRPNRAPEQQRNGRKKKVNSDQRRNTGRFKSLMQTTVYAMGALGIRVMEDEQHGRPSWSRLLFRKQDKHVVICRIFPPGKHYQIKSNPRMNSRGWATLYQKGQGKKHAS